MTNQTNIRFWAGMRTIGGTVVTIEYGGARILFDFGTAFLGDLPITDKHIRLREDALVRDYIQLGVLPAIDGLYAGESLGSGIGLVPAEDSPLETAVFISHLHLDHMSMMGLIAPTVPVYMTSDSKRLYDTLAEIGEGVTGMREFQSMEMRETVRVGGIEVTALPMDHDVPGACAFHIRTPDGSLLYTGDFRFHGLHPEQTTESLATAKSMGIDAAIIEGTMLWEPEADGSLGELYGDLAITDETAVESALTASIAATLKETGGLAVFNLYHRNVERLITIAEAAREAGRVLVLEPETACVLLMHTDIRDALVYETAGLRRAIGCDILTIWQKRVTEEFTRVSAEGLNLEPSRYLVQNSYHNLLELLDLRTEGGVYIHSDGSPLGSYDPSFERLLHFLERVGLSFQPHRVTGHAYARHLKWAADFLDPNVLIPLHSFFPERLLPNTGTQLLPEAGRTYVLKDGTIQAAE